MLQQSNTPENDWISTRLLLALIGVLVGLIALAFIAIVVLVSGLSVTSLASRIFSALFAVNSVQALWYVTRAAGIIAYLLLWLATAWGLAVSSKIFDPWLQGAFTYDFHQFLSLLAIGFVLLHVLVLLADRYLPFSVAAILVPFVAPYRPLWVGVGIIGFYLMLLVSATFYMRRRIGMKAFRTIHMLSYATFAFAAVHGLMAGTDSPLPTTQLMYAGTMLVIVFLTVYRVTLSLINKQPQKLAKQTKEIISHN